MWLKSELICRNSRKQGYQYREATLILVINHGLPSTFCQDILNMPIGFYCYIFSGKRGGKIRKNETV